MTFGNLLPLALLLAYGVAFAWAALGFSAIAFDDHPGQLYRMWHVVAHGWAPWAWNPGWWAGYPELQFYPPGLSYAGALLHTLSRRALSIAASYQALVWLAYLAPGLTVWLLLRRVVGDGWLALPGAFVTLTLSAGLASGVEGGVHMGMVGARLGWAALPLLPLLLAGWMSGARDFPWAVVPLLAGITLTHPAHLPAATVLVLLAAWLARLPRRIALGHVAAALGLAAGLVGFWVVPLLARTEHTRALAWGPFPPWEILGRPVIVGLVILAALGIFSLSRRSESAPPLVILLTLFPWAMIVVVLIDAYVVEPLGLHWLPADRIADSAWLGIVLSSGLTLGRLIGVPRRPRVLAVASVVAVIAAVSLLPGRETLTLWSRAPNWPRYETLDRGMRLEALWSALRAAPAGRVLFIRSGVPLVYGSEWWRPHSHVTALTPLAAGRDIINGTFTHPSPVAALVYRGDAGPGAIRELVERLDGRRLFGRDLGELDAPTFDGYADRLGISVVVGLDEDLPRLRVLAEKGRFASAPASPPFILYTRRLDIPPPTEVEPGRLRLTAEAPPDTWVPARMAYYPLWQATSEGRPVPLRRGPLGDLELRVPRTGAPIDLVYERGAPEASGLAVTAAALVALAIVWIGPFRRGTSRPTGPPS